MHIFDAARTAELLPYGPLADAVARTLALKAQGLVTAPERLSVLLPGGAVLLVMPASDGKIAITKMVTVHPGNAARGLPLIRGEAVVLDAVTGERLAMLDGPAVTARRTASASLLAARLLAQKPGGPLLLLGAGVQAKAHGEAFMAGLGVTEVFISARNRAAAEALASHLRGLGAAAVVLAGAGQKPGLTPGNTAGNTPGQAPCQTEGQTLDHALERATLIVTATASPVPVLPETVRDDAFIAAVGSFSPGVAEIPAGLVRRCALYVDSLEGAHAEAGDLLLAGVDWRRVTPLELALAGREHADGPVLYKSVGHAALDLAAARLALGLT